MALASAAALLALGWLALPWTSTAFAESALIERTSASVITLIDTTQSGAVQAAGETPPGPDPRWLALMQAELEAKSGARQPAQTEQATAAELSLHLDLTRGAALGQALTDDDVYLEVRRNGQQVAEGSGSALFEGDRFSYRIDYLFWDDPDCDSYSEYCQLQPFLPGDVVRVTQAGAAISLSIPALSALADPFTDRVYGQAVPNSPLTAYLFPAALESNTYITRSLTVSPSGNYQVDFQPAGGLRGDDDGFIQQRLDSQRSLYRHFVVPYMRVYHESGVVSGRVAPNSIITLALTIPGGQSYTNSEISSYDGSFNGQYFNYNYAETLPHPPGSSVCVQAGGQTISLTLMELSANADLERQSVSGRGPAGADLRIERYPGPKFSYETGLSGNVALDIFTTTINIGGVYTTSLPLARPNYGYSCQVTPENSQMCAQFVVPYFEFGLGPLYLADSYLLNAQVPAYNRPVTVAIAGPSGYLKSFLNRKTNPDGLLQIMGEYFDPYYPFLGGGIEENILLAGGDLVTITMQHQGLFVQTLPELTAIVDSASDQIYGQAPPEAQLTLIFWENGFLNYSSDIIYSQTVPVSSDGSYLVDLKNIYDIHEYSAGELRYITPEGHTIQRSFSSGQACRLTVSHVEVGSNMVQLNGEACLPGSITLEDADGQLKAYDEIKQNTYSWAQVIYFTDSNRQPVAIAPGDRVTLNDGYALTSYAIPTFDLEIDSRNDRVQGQAPPGAIIDVYLYPFRAFTYHYYGARLEISATASPTGAFSAEFSGLFDLGPGDILISYFQQDGVKYRRMAPIPYLQVNIGADDARGHLPPLSPYTLIIERPGLIFTDTGRSNIDGSIQPYLSLPGYGSIIFHPGDRVRLETPAVTLSATIPALSTQIDLTRAVVSGSAPPGAALYVALNDRPLNWNDGSIWEGILQATIAAADGSFQAEFPDQAPMQVAHGAVLYTPPEGIFSAHRFSSPRFNIDFDNYSFSGYTWAPGLPYTVTVSPLVSPAIVVTRTEDASYGTFDIYLSTPLQPGDHLSLQMPGYPDLEYTVPVLSAMHDFTHQTLTGEAPPNRLIEVEFNLGSKYYRRTYSSAAGRYGIDTSDLPLVRGTRGHVTVYEPGLATLQRSFVVQGYQVFLPTLPGSGPAETAP